MIEQPLVSVIVPVWNRESTVIRALDSVAGQIYRPIEIVIVDDGSTDNSLKLIKSWASANSNDDLLVKVICKVNGGASSARNEGLRNSEGQFIQFLDSDDYYTTQRTSLLVKALQDNPDIDYVWSDSIYSTEAQSDPIFNQKIRKFRGRALKIVPLQVTRGLFKRSLCDSTGYWAEELRREEDWVYKVRSMIRSRGAAHIPVATYIRTEDADNQTSSTEPVEYARQLQVACTYLEKCESRSDFLVSFALCQAYASVTLLLLKAQHFDEAKLSASKSFGFSRGLRQRGKALLFLLLVYGTPGLAYHCSASLHKRASL